MPAVDEIVRAVESRAITLLPGRVRLALGREPSEEHARRRQRVRGAALVRYR